MDKDKNLAIISSGGKQYSVQEGDTLRVELLGEDPGKTVTFSDVLLIEENGKTMVGNPTVSGASVVGKVEGRVQGDKLYVLKKKKRKGFQKRTGHRQKLHLVTIEKISGKPAKSASAKGSDKDSGE